MNTEESEFLSLENTRRDCRCKELRQFNYDVFLESMTAMLEKEVISSELQIYIYIYIEEKKNRWILLSNEICESTCDSASCNEILRRRSVIQSLLSPEITLLRYKRNM